ncbi:GGDEF domain-containing protein [Christensenellaceae bacterium OttesenSCG-928-L17]|nr:GGDEF domain-containing protein [Christensenellaceae bacterium OttesenSCG-928-L17]
MFNALETWIFRVLSKRDEALAHELNQYVLVSAVAIAATSLHIFFALFFHFAGCAPLAISHAFSIPVFVLCVLLLRKRHFDLAALLLSAMIVFSTLATVHFIGGDNYSIFYQLLVLVMLTAIPFKRRHIPAIAAVTIPLLMIATEIYDTRHTPLYDVGMWNRVLGMINILVGSLGVVLQLSLERIVRNFVNRFHVKRMEELEDQVYLDPLTRLYNRRYGDLYFENLQKDEDAATEEICVALADLDDFKQINDTYGHEAGDVMLKTISDILKSNVRKTDVVFRWGGEEFLMVIHASLANSFLLLDRIREAIAATTIRYEDVDLRITITMGIAKLDLENVADSLDACDQKLYEGKRGGKNRVVK